MKKICFLFLTVFTLLFSACSGRSGAEQSDETEDKEWYYVIESFGLGMTRTFSELGVLRSRSEGAHRGVCYFFDPVSGREVPLCAKTNCTHQGASWGNPHPDCDAWLGELIGFAGIIGDSLYYVSVDSEDGFLRAKICRADPDGTNRKVLEVMDNVQYLQAGDAFYQNGYLIFEYLTDIAQDGTRLEKRRSGICIYDLERNEAEYMIGPENYGAENYSAATVNVMVVDHCLYYCYYYNTEDYRKISYEDLSDEKYAEYLDTIGRREIWAYDLDTKEKRLVLQESGSHNFSVGFGYAYTDGKRGARLIDLRTGESRELEDPERFRFKVRKVIEEGVLFCGDGSIDLWEFETGEVKHIGGYDKDLMISIEYVGRNWVYGLLYSGGPGKIFYLPKEQFMKGDMEWKYLPQEES